MIRVIAVVAAALVVACSGTANVDGAKVLRDGGAAMAQLKTVARH